MNSTVHFILKGMMDRPMIESILEEMAARPYIHYRADAASLYSVDFASACLLKDQVERMEGQLAILNLNAECRVALQYCGWNLHDGVALATRAPASSESENVISASQARCPECGKSLQVEGAGLYGCPVCGCRFHSDIRGRTTPYESLGISK
ncbi:MAG: hypothetical protein KDK25_15925 [Leptospiraceae bacterium]|nr:hypothetical protein [Leptospiraceae bacterium]MCB1171836.1 hypothetical protein [Leptospiraceae bacterium]